MTVSSFFPEVAPPYGLPPADTILWEIVSGGGPASVLDLDTVKDFLNIPLEDEAYDAEKEGFVVAAQTALEAYLQLSIAMTTWVGYAPAFYNTMRINRRPFRSVTKVEYVDASTGEIVTLDSSVYATARAAQRCGMIVLGDGQQWPAAANRPDAVRITAVAGWDKPDIPPEIKSALLMVIAVLDHARGDDGAGMGAPRTVYAMKHMMAPSILPESAKAITARYRLLTFGAA